MINVSFETIIIIVLVSLIAGMFLGASMARPRGF
jgi:hypothetical protein